MFNDPTPDLLRSVKSEDFLPPIGLWTTLGSFILVGTVSVGVTLAAIIKYNVTVKAPAAVRPTGEILLVQAGTAGAVKRILVKENQVVKLGQVIATLDDSQLQTKKRQLEGDIQNGQRQLTQIAAQIKALDAQRSAESSVVNRTVSSAQADLSRNERDYRERQVTTQTEVQEAVADLELARVQMKQYQTLANTGAIAQLQIKEKEQAFKAALIRLERAKVTLNPSGAPVTIATERIAQDRAKGEATLATLHKERESLKSAQTNIQNQLNRDRQALQQIGQDLKQSVVLAPAAGTILKLELRNPGQSVRPGESIAQIAPGNAVLTVKARVAAQDISNVKVCQEKQVETCQAGNVQLRVSAYPYPDYGTLRGAVKAIAPDVITPQGSGTPYYEVTIQPEKPYLLKSERQYPIQPGMEGTANIISREETILTFILRKARLLTDL